MKKQVALLAAAALSLTAFSNVEMCIRDSLQVVLDGLVIVISYLIAWYIMIRSVDRDEVGVLPAEVYLMVLLMVVPFLLLLYYACNLYAPKRIQGRRLEGGNILKANTICGLTLMAALFWFCLLYTSRCV